MTRRRVGEIAAAVLLAIGLAMALLAPTEPTRRDFHPRSAQPHGLRALWRTLERLGEPVEIWAQESTHLHGRGGLLVLGTTEAVAGRRRAGGKGEAGGGLGEWVAAGNALAVPLDHQQSSGDLLAREFGWAGIASEGSEKQVPGTRLAAPDPFPTAITGLPAGARPALGDPKKPFAATIRHGQGTVLLLASVAPLTNAALRLHAENLDACLPLLASLVGGSGRRGTLWLDASFLGDREYPSALSLAFEPRALVATLHVLLAVALFALARGVRFGNARDPLPTEIHRASEAAAGIASLYRRAERPALAAGAIASGFAERARRGLGAPRDLETEALAERIAARASIPKDRARELLAGRAESDSDLLHRTQESLAVERRLARAGGAGAPVIA